MAEEKSSPDSFLGWVPWKDARVIVASLFSAGLDVVFFWLAPSRTMRAFIGVGALLAFILAFGLIPLLFRYKARSRRGYFAIVFVFMMVVSLLVGASLSWVIDPDVVREHPQLEPVYDFLVAPATWANILAGLTAGGVAFFLTAALVIVSPLLDKQSGKRKQTENSE